MSKPKVPKRVSNVVTGDSVDVIDRLAPWYLDGRMVVDLTPGDKLGFWHNYTTSGSCDGTHRLLICKNYNVELSPHNYHALPYKDGQWDTVVYDPSFVVCHSLDTKIMTKRGWLSYGEVKVGDLAWTLNHEANVGEWCPIEDVIVTEGSPREVHEWKGKSHSSRSDADHDWPIVVVGPKGYGPYRDWAKTSELGNRKVNASIPMAVKAGSFPTQPVHSDAWVELVAWFYTEGHIEGTRCGESTEGLSPYGYISQSPAVNPDKCARIEQCLSGVAEQVEYFPRVGRTTDTVSRWRLTTNNRPPLNDKNSYYFNVDLGRRLLDSAPNLLPSVEFLDSLTENQLNLFLGTCIDGDGSRSKNNTTVFVQKNRTNSFPFEYAAKLLGISTSALPYEKDGNQWVRICARKSKSFKPARQPNRTIETSIERLWCVKTRNKTWMAERDGFSFFTGNCGTKETKDAEAMAMKARYGLLTTPETPEELYADMISGFKEAVRVCKVDGFVIFKCQQQVSSGNIIDWPYLIKRRVEKWNVKLYNEIIQDRGLGMQPLTRTLKDGTVVLKDWNRLQTGCSNWLIWQKTKKPSKYTSYERMFS